MAIFLFLCYAFLFLCSYLSFNSIHTHSSVIEGILSKSPGPARPVNSACAAPLTSDSKGEKFLLRAKSCWLQD